MVVYDFSCHSVEVVENLILGVLSGVTIPEGSGLRMETIKGENKMSWVIGTLDDLDGILGGEHICSAVGLLVPVEVIGYLETVVVLLITVDHIVKDGKSLGSKVQLAQEGFHRLLSLKYFDPIPQMVE